MHLRSWHSRGSRHGLAAASALAACLVAGTIAFAQEKKEEEPPFWAIGKPKTGPGAAKMAPVAAPPVPTAADKLPQLQVPAGFKVEVFQPGLLDARAIRRGDKGTIFVCSLFVAVKILRDLSGEGEGQARGQNDSSGLELPSGLDFEGGSLYVATPKEDHALRRHRGQARQPAGSRSTFSPTCRRTFRTAGSLSALRSGRQTLRAGRRALQHLRARCPRSTRRSSASTPMAVDVRSWRTAYATPWASISTPVTKQLWFTDNQRDWLSEDMPLDELNPVVKSAGKDHFGFPFCHSGIMTATAARLGQVVQRRRGAGQDAAGAACGAARHEVLHRQAVPAEVPRCDPDRPPRPLEPHQEVR